MHESVKPDDIPCDVWDAARLAINDALRDPRQSTAVRFAMINAPYAATAEAIARAILADRARPPQDATAPTCSIPDEKRTDRSARAGRISSTSDRFNGRVERDSVEGIFP